MTTSELEQGIRGRIASFDAADMIGRVITEDGESLRFGGSACVGFRPEPSLEVFITAVAPHPLGGRRAVKLRTGFASEAQARAAEAAARAIADAAAQIEADRLRAAAIETTTDAAIAQRIAQAIADDVQEPDMRLLYALVGDLERVGKQPAHVEAILRAIAAADPEAHFGSPGPLVHYVESFPEAEPLFAIAAAHPTMHFVWMLARHVNDEGDTAATARDILADYAARAPTASVREAASSFLASRGV